MTLVPCTRLHTSDPELNQVQDNLIRRVNPALAAEILDGRLVTDVSVATSATNVNHGLGRAYQGWVIVDNNTDCRVWSPSTGDTTKVIVLQSSAATTITLWVF